LAGVFSYAAAGMVLDHFIIRPGFESLEQQDALRDLNRCQTAIQREIDALDLLCLDWASWDNSYKFAQGQDLGYIEANITKTIHSTTELNLLMIYDTAGELLAGGAYDLEAKEAIELPQFPASLREDHYLLSHKSVDIATRGIILTSRGPMLISSRPILTSDLTGPPTGTILMGRYLDKKRSMKLQNQALVNMHLELIDGGSLTSDERSVCGTLRPGAPGVIRQASIRKLHCFAVLADIKGRPLLMLRADIPRNVTLIGDKVIRKARVLALAIAMCVLIVMLMMLRVAFVRPIMKLARGVSKIGESRDLSSRIDISRDDEIGLLASEFNRMLEALEESANIMKETNEILHEEIDARKCTEADLLAARAAAISSAQRSTWRQ
ncbi:MAG: CHASE4 domain-containing protein, partial [Phycisphaerae bacterium]|nr:CHASE4 domain-containing protein [Phycisphaerae bacterium]